MKLVPIDLLGMACLIRPNFRSDYEYEIEYEYDFSNLARVL